MHLLDVILKSPHLRRHAMFAFLSAALVLSVGVIVTALVASPCGSYRRFVHCGHARFEPIEILINVVSEMALPLLYLLMVSFPLVGACLRNCV